jgi:hypothetical protein
MDDELNHCIVRFHSRLDSHPTLASVWLDYLEAQRYQWAQDLEQAWRVEQAMSAGTVPDLDLKQISAMIALTTTTPLATTTTTTTPTTMPTIEEHKAKLLLPRKRLNTI